MFEQAKDRVDTGRSRVLLIAFGVVVALVVVGVLLSSRCSSVPVSNDVTPRGLANASRAGDPVFDKYKLLVQLQKKEYFTQANMLGQLSAFGKGRLVNLSDKTITGVELRGNVVGAENKLLATTVAIPVPRVKESIPPRGSMEYTVNIQNVPNGIKEKDIYDINVELEGLIVEE
jgi:hypothetical protein